ncbi:outer membrane protein assembly factor BamB family protein [Oceanibacterium hippocampi]|uniref:Outer membrane protein assembly factor BamB n=1 Tax=Oceanibacterium hippocampi TaxID=745714 RepID=A0A1Y5ST41_9PROT|nr:PQQ-like beta-propeller repeat protein [Oceanibacterium hippocampi]SLN47818.1 Outer membrane protein assembly factor BamB precursor [Oceanibacterium hippocampi]
MNDGTRRRVAALARSAVLGALFLAPTACSLPDWLGGYETDKPLPGERISVLALESKIEPDPRVADVEVRLPRPYVNTFWPQAGGVASHAMYHLELGAAPREIWRADIGSGSDRDSRLMAQPVVAAGRVFTMDSESRVTAFGVADGKRLWRVDLTPDYEEEGTIGGGLAYWNGTLYAATAYGEVFALAEADGAIAWHHSIGVPVRAAPTVADGRVFAISFDNQMHALSTATGEEEWTHIGLEEQAGLLGAASAAADGGIVIAPYSSGEIYALRADNGRAVWSDQLTRTRPLTNLGALSDINGRPVIDRGVVFAVSNAGRMVAISLRSGERLWEQDIASLQGPWVAGDFVYLVTSDAEVVCLSRRDGRIRWVRQLQRYEDEEDREDPVFWSGPVLAGDRLILVSSHGQALAVSPYSGRLLGWLPLSDNSSIAPVVADGTLFILTDDAKLVALR